MNVTDGRCYFRPGYRLIFVGQVAFIIGYVGYYGRLEEQFA
jgi:hypothetical protein